MKRPSFVPLVPHYQITRISTRYTKMSMGDVDAKFPGQHTDIPPSPTRENPGQVYPKSDPNQAPNPIQRGDNGCADTTTGNPFLIRTALEGVDNQLAEVILVLEEEQRSQGGSNKGRMLLNKFWGWRSELNDMIHGGHVGLAPLKNASTEAEHEGGLFVD